MDELQSGVNDERQSRGTDELQSGSIQYDEHQNEVMDELQNGMILSDDGVGQYDDLKHCTIHHDELHYGERHRPVRGVPVHKKVYAGDHHDLTQAR